MLLRPIVPDRDGYPLGGDRGEKSWWPSHKTSNYNYRYGLAIASILAQICNKSGLKSRRFRRLAKIKDL
jgi:hypothetical protein